MITIKAPSGGSSFQIEPPLWGYASSIFLSIEIQKHKDNTYGFWDNSSSYDFRTFKGTFFLNKTQTLNLINAFQDNTKGRGVDVDLILPSDSGFFPYGADKGDAGTFKSRLVNINAQRTIGHPEDYFNTEMEFIFDGSWPSYTPPSQVKEGELQIGTIQNLRWPSAYHNQNIDYAVDTILSRDGTPYSIDKTSSADSYESTLPMVLNESNTAALINHLVGTVRTNDVNIIPPTNSYLFGREKGSTATYVCKWIQTSLDITHEMHNRFSFDLKFYRVSGV